jgi:hypothetical protein
LRRETRQIWRVSLRNPSSSAKDTPGAAARDDAA